MLSASPINIFWFRRDLRLDDNAGLFHALNAGIPVLPLFIFDSDILSQLENKHDKRVDLIHQRLHQLNALLISSGHSLFVKIGKPAEVFEQLCNDFNVQAVYCNKDYEPSAIIRDAGVEKTLSTRQVKFNSFKDQVIFEENEILKPDGLPYTVFTPYSKKWKAAIQPRHYQSFGSESLTDNFINTTGFTVPPLEQIGFESTGVSWPKVNTEPETLQNYAATRNYPAQAKGTTNLSVHLRFGTISIRKMVKAALVTNEEFLNELIWREFFMSILYHFPYAALRSFKPGYDEIKWRNNEAEFEKWCNGNTGFPIVDAGMRELNATGLMHNRVRMVTASFLVKHLLIDWRWGEAYFAQKLLDYDLAANNGNWQWAAGCGCDAAPYFRVFNPAEQTKRFDAELKYIRKWVPELDSIHYPLPMVEHSFARNRALETFKQALTGD